MRKTIHTENAPQAIGTYSQAVQVDNLIFLSGQIPLDPNSMEIVSDDVETQIKQVFRNLQAVLNAADADLSHLIKLNVYLTDLGHFPLVNAVMAEHFTEPYPARAAIEVSALPKGVSIEIEGIAEAQ